MTCTYRCTPPLPTPQSVQYLTTSEVGQILHVSERIVGLYIRSQGLKAARVGKRWLITADEINRFIASHIR